MEALPQIFFVLIAAASIGVVAHVFIRRVVPASVAAGVASGSVFVIAGYVQDHQISAVPFIFGGLFAFVFALFIGLFFYLARK
jgi:uncharacterized membrane protein (UPF0136 family)